MTDNDIINVIDLEETSAGQSHKNVKARLKIALVKSQQIVIRRKKISPGQSQ
jgi:hypothetical protein